MSLEARVQLLEEKHDALEHAFRENNKVLEATHGVVSLVLQDVQDVKKDIYEFKKEVHEFKKEVHEFKKEVRGSFKKQDERFDQLELLIRQHFTNS